MHMFGVWAVVAFPSRLSSCLCPLYSLMRAWWFEGTMITFSSNGTWRSNAFWVLICEVLWLGLISKKTSTQGAAEEPQQPGVHRGPWRGLLTVLCCFWGACASQVSLQVQTSSSVGFLKLLSFLKKLCLSLDVWRKQFSIFLQFPKLLLPG